MLAAIEAGAFGDSLELTSLPPSSQTHGWIVDTSIECDHECFNGFLKISVEEMIIALRDDAPLAMQARRTVPALAAGPMR